MPQMAPLSWLTLFFIFSLFIILTSNKIWFSSPMTNSTSNTTHNNKLSSHKSDPYSWKW